MGRPCHDGGKDDEKSSDPPAPDQGDRFPPCPDREVGDLPLGANRGECPYDKAAMMDNQLTPADVRAWREIAGMNQEEFGAMLGLSRATIARIESPDGEVPTWMSLAREGWRTRRGHGLEAEVRRIVRSEMAAAGVLVEDTTIVPTRFEDGQIFHSLKHEGRTATVIECSPDGMAAHIRVEDDGTFLSEGEARWPVFINNWEYVTG
jgi:DNA-binding XRE family transcriptional regulator